MKFRYRASFVDRNKDTEAIAGFLSFESLQNVIAS